MSMQETRQAGDEEKDPAESTRFRASPFPDHEDATPAVPGRRSSDTYLPSSKSIRMNARVGRGSLAVKLALPIAIAMLAGQIFMVFLLRDRLSRMQMRELRMDAANAVFTTGLVGRTLFNHQQEFARNHPEYAERGEWLVGDHWLATMDFVSDADWVEATGFELEEYAPAATLDEAGRRVMLMELSRFINSPSVDGELAAVYLLNPDGTELASAGKHNFRFNPHAITVPGSAGRVVEVGGQIVQVDYLDDVGPEPLVRGTARILSLEDPERTLGTVVAVLRTRARAEERSAFLAMISTLGLVLTIVVVAACWYAVKRVVVPIRSMAADMQAMAEGDYNRRAGSVESDELGLLSQAFNSMAQRLHVARLNEKETSRLEADLETARQIQNNLLPLQTPRVRGLDIHTAYRPARTIGGDYFDFLMVDERHMGLVVADASGKSIPAALVMSTTRAILRFVAPGTTSAAETLTQVNAILSVDIPKGLFVTAYYLILDPLERTMLCASAGHTPLLIAKADDTVEILNPGGIALGFDSGPIFQRSIREQRVKLEAGDRVLLYTDGVVECVNREDEEYSDRRLREFLRRNRELSSHDFVGALMADLDRHRGATEMRDDTTIVTFRVV